MRKLKITIGSVEISVELFETPTADAIWAVLPFDAEAQTWGKEVYFTTPVTVSLEPDARDVVEAGELAFWVAGKAVAVGFGPTPASRDGEIRLVEPANIWGRTRSDVQQLGSVRAGTKIRVEALPDEA
jgi:hypothetical protein